MKHQLRILLAFLLLGSTQVNAQCTVDAGTDSIFAACGADVYLAAVVIMTVASVTASTVRLVIYAKNYRWETESATCTSMKPSMAMTVVTVGK